MMRDEQRSVWFPPAYGRRSVLRVALGGPQPPQAARSSPPVAGNVGIPPHPRRESSPQPVSQRPSRRSRPRPPLFRPQALHPRRMPPRAWRRAANCHRPRRMCRTPTSRRRRPSSPSPPCQERAGKYRLPRRRSGPPPCRTIRTNGSRNSKSARARRWTSRSCRCRSTRRKRPR